MSRSFLIIAFIVIGALGGWVSPVGAYREYFTPEQKAQLDKIQVVLIELLALTDKGGVDSGPLTSVVSRRLSEVGYTVVQDPSKAYDAVVRVKCEQRKTWEGTASSGGDNDLPDAPSRLWKGPACQLSYALGGMKIKWQKEVRTDFEDASAAALAAQAGEPGDVARTGVHLGRRAIGDVGGRDDRRPGIGDEKVAGRVVEQRDPGTGRDGHALGRAGGQDIGHDALRARPGDTLALVLVADQGDRFHPSSPTQATV